MGHTSYPGNGHVRQDTPPCRTCQATRALAPRHGAALVPATHIAARLFPAPPSSGVVARDHGWLRARREVSASPCPCVSGGLVPVFSQPSARRERGPPSPGMFHGHPGSLGGRVCLRRAFLRMTCPRTVLRTVGDGPSTRAMSRRRDGWLLWTDAGSRRGFVPRTLRLQRLAKAQAKREPAR